jgi:hypothetical protein
MLKYRESFNQEMGVKNTPNNHEIYLMGRAQRYIKKLSWIPGLRMIAVVNSLSMYATHENSDIDLFVITSPNVLWLVRFLMTAELWIL